MTSMVLGVNRMETLNARIFPGAAVAKQADFFAQKTITPSGDTNIQIQKKEPAKAWHYILIAAGLAAVVIYAHKRLEF